MIGEAISSELAAVFHRSTQKNCPRALRPLPLPRRHHQLIQPILSRLDPVDGGCFPQLMRVSVWHTGRDKDRLTRLLVLAMRC
jgi:hypothetical protein